MMKIHHVVGPELFVCRLRSPGTSIILSALTILIQMSCLQLSRFVSSFSTSSYNHSYGSCIIIKSSHLKGNPSFPILLMHFTLDDEDARDNNALELPWAFPVRQELRLDRLIAFEAIWDSVCHKDWARSSAQSFFLLAQLFIASGDFCFAIVCYELASWSMMQDSWDYCSLSWIGYHFADFPASSITIH